MAHSRAAATVEHRDPSLPSIPSWARLLIVDLGCCGAAALQIGAPQHGLAGLDGRAYDLAPQQANVLVVAGRMVPAFGPTLQALYAQLGRPAWTIAFGDCAVCGGIANTVPADDVIAIDVALPGCPPRPQELRAALAHLSRRRPR